MRQRALVGFVATTTLLCLPAASVHAAPNFGTPASAAIRDVYTHTNGTFVSIVRAEQLIAPSPGAPAVLTVIDWVPHTWTQLTPYSGRYDTPWTTKLTSGQWYYWNVYHQNAAGGWVQQAYLSSPSLIQAP